MEKICIVRRRQDIQRFGADSESAYGTGTVVNQRRTAVLSNAVRNDAGTPGRETSPVDARAENRNSNVSFSLTAEQSEVVRSSSFARYLSSGAAGSAVLDLQQQEDGRMSLNFYFDGAKSPRLLKSKDVCEMLQVSRSFLWKLIKTNQLKCYRLGILWRFELEDIIEFLAGNVYHHDSQGKPEEARFSMVVPAAYGQGRK